MVEVDARDDREDRRQNVGGVEAAAQANFDNPEFNAFAREAFERHGGNAFEIRGVSAKPVPTEKLLDELQQASKIRAKDSSSISLPSKRMRSLILSRCGEVYSPVRKPACRRIDSRKADVEPLPLVPAM